MNALILTHHIRTTACDLWFKKPLSKTWVPAQLMRDQAKEAQQRVGKNLTSTDDGL